MRFADLILCRWLSLTALALAWPALAPLAAAATPLDLPIKEDSTMNIQVDYQGNDIFPEGTQRGQHGTYHYTVYIPKGYHEDPERRYPCMFSMMGGLPTEWLKQNRWIYIQLKELNFLRKHAPFGLEIFHGGHNAAPAEQAVRAMEWFTEQLYRNPRAGVTPRQAAWLVLEQAPRLAEIQPEYARYRRAVLFQELAAKFGLAASPKLTGPLQQTAAVLQELGPRSLTEKLAEKAFAEAQLSELRARTGGEIYRPNPAPVSLSRIRNAYQEVAEKHPDTQYGKLAADRAGKLAD